MKNFVFCPNGIKSVSCQPRRLSRKKPTPRQYKNSFSQNTNRATNTNHCPSNASIMASRSSIPALSYQRDVSSSSIMSGKGLETPRDKRLRAIETIQSRREKFQFTRQKPSTTNGNFNHQKITKKIF